MYFRVLGPLEAVDNGRPVRLGGHRQRATLGLMLLHANRVVATSDLLKELWGIDEAPLTARKVLQNAVRGLRVLFKENGRADGAPALLTSSPGYVLRVEPTAVDLFQFHHLAEKGRAELAAGDTEAAAETLRTALTLWRGPALADLVEAGYHWSELTALQNVRLDVMEDYFEAQLANGLHQTMLGELEVMVEAEPLRERLCHQLMLALYRSGRQADALEIYSRVRSILVERLGLEPGRDLQALQRGILAHDPSLSDPAGPGPEQVISRNGREIPREQVASWPPPTEHPTFGLPVLRRPVRLERRRSLAQVLSPPVALREPRYRRQVSAMMIRVDVGERGRGADMDELLEGVATAAREEVERLGGIVASSIGSVSLAVFGSGSARDNSAERAVRAALAFRDRVCSAEFTAIGWAGPRIAVATGDVPARRDGSSTLPVNAGLLVECESLLELAGTPEIVVCGRTRQLTCPNIGYVRDGDSPGGRPKWRVHGELVSPVWTVDREPELDLLDSLLDRVRHRARPHLVTVIGAAGIGKSRLLASFAGQVVGAATVGPFLTGQTPRLATCWILCGEILFSCCGIERGDSPDTARAKLDRVVRRAAKNREVADRMLSRLRRFLEPCVPVISAEITEAVVRDWWAVVGKVAELRPLVVFADDIHRGDDELLDFVEDLLAPPGPMPILVVTAASPELFQRRPEWGKGTLPATMMRLDPLAKPCDPAVPCIPAERPDQLGDAAS